MANHSETNAWGSVYQWETTDPLLAGAGGIMNNPIAALVGRTGYLKSVLDKTLFNSGIAQITGATTIDASYQGKAAFVSGGADYDIQLPDASGLVGRTFFFFHNAAEQRVYTFKVFGTQTISIGGISKSQIQLKPRRWFCLIAGTTGWQSIGDNPFDGVGEIRTLATASIPVECLECNGQAVSRTKYADLFEVIGVTFGAGNGSTTFNLPDLRGQFIRGWDNGSSVDPGRSFGTNQGDAVGSHTHTIDRVGYTSIGGTGGKFVGNANTPDAGQGTTNASGGAETRPVNVALNFCIRY